MMLFKTLAAVFVTLAMTSSNSSCSNWFRVDQDEDPTKLTYKAFVGTQKDILSPKLDVLDTQEKLDDFLNKMPSRTTEGDLPAYDSDSDSRVGIISVMKACDFTPELQEVIERKDIVQVKILNKKVSNTASCETTSEEIYRYFIVVFEDKEKPITVLTETEKTS